MSTSSDMDDEGVVQEPEIGIQAGVDIAMAIYRQIPGDALKAIDAVHTNALRDGAGGLRLQLGFHGRYATIRRNGRDTYDVEIGTGRDENRRVEATDTDVDCDQLGDVLRGLVLGGA